MGRGDRQTCSFEVKRREEEDMTLARWEKMKRFEKTKEIRMRKKMKKEIPATKIPEHWWWRKEESQDLK